MHVVRPITERRTGAFGDMGDGSHQVLAERSPYSNQGGAHYNRWMGTDLIRI